MSQEKEWFGGCLCSRVRYRASGDPEWIGICHCRSCRKHTGGILNAAAGFPRARVTFTGEPEVYMSSVGVERFFCSRCGSALAYQSDQWPKDVHLFVGTFDDPELLEPQFHLFSKEQLTWLKLADDLTRFPTTPSAGNN